MANELNINMDEYTGSCDANEMKRHLREEMIEQLPGQTRYQESAKQLADLKQKELKAQIDGLQNTESFKNEKIRLMSEVAKIKIDLNKEKNNNDSRIEKNNSLLTKLYSLRESFKNRPLKEGETEQDRAKDNLKIEFDTEGKPSLVVQMEGAHGFDFTIHDGKVVFNGEMSDDKLLEVLDFLYRHGIRNFELPSNQKGTSFEEVYTRVQQQREADKETHMPEPPARGEEPFTQTAPNQETERTAQAAYAAQASTQQASAATTTTATATGTRQNPANVDKTEFEEVTKDFEGWLGDKNQMKKKDLSWFKESSFFGNDVTYSVYNSEDKKNLENDGKRDKNNVKKETCAYRVRLKKSKDGKLDSLEYYVPNSGKIPDPLADKLAEMIKNQGALFMNFPEIISPADAGVFRGACGRAGIIPTGKSFNLTKGNAEDMVAEAQKTLGRNNPAKFSAYKAQLGRHLLSLESDPNSERYAYAKELLKDGKYADFEKTLDPLLKNIERESRKPNAKAEEIIGSADAIKDLHSLFDTFGSQSLADIANNDSIDDHIKRAAQSVTISSAKPIEDLTAEEMNALYNALKRENTDRARNNLQRKTLGCRPDKVSERVESQLQGAQKTINGVISSFNRRNLKTLSCDINETNPTFTPTNTNQNGNQATLAATARTRLAQTADY